MLSANIYNNIPFEIWCKIIQHLSQKDLFECQKVCKSWYLSTRQSFWENVELKTADHVELFLNSSPKDATEFVKGIVIGEQYPYDWFIDYTFSKQQLKELLLSLPNLENIYITDQFSKGIIPELSNEEFLIELCEKSSNIQSFKAFEAQFFYHSEDYGNIMYYLKNTARSIIVNNTEHNIYQHITSFSQLEHLTMYEDKWSFRKFVEFLYKIKKLAQLKYLNFNFNLTIEDKGQGEENIGEEMDMKNVLKIIEEDRELKEKLKSLKKLHLRFDGTSTYSNDTNIITQYFVGLKEIDVFYLYSIYGSHSDVNSISNEWADFIFSHDKYRLEIQRTDVCHYSDLIKMCLEKNFKQDTTDKKAAKHLWLELDCTDYNSLNLSEWDSYFMFNPSFTLQFESEINDNQLLKFAKIQSMNGKDTSSIICEILDSTNHVMENIDTLTFEFTDNYENNIPFNVFQQTGQILSLTTDTLKKVIIRTRNHYKWSKLFARYEKVKTYRQVTHLEIYVYSNNSELLDELTLSQFALIFSSINYLTLEYLYDTHPSYIPKNSDVFINLPQINLKRLTLDATTLKLRAQEAMKIRDDFLDTYFILKVDANKKLYYYQISLDFLNVTELVKGDRELNLKRTLQVHIILKNIDCLELYFIHNVYIRRETKKLCEWSYRSEFDTIKEKICERRIYFE